MVGKSLKSYPDNIATNNFHSKYKEKIMTIDIQNARKILTNALITNEGDEYLIKRTFSMLFPKICLLRSNSFSFEQITTALSEGGFTISTSTVICLYHELLNEQIFELIDHKSLINSLNELAHTDLHCLPLRSGIKQLERRDNVLEEVYMDCQLEHPAIRGLKLSKDERLYSAQLEIMEVDGKERFETSVEKYFRILWKQPIPAWVSNRK
jgi:hypothetical protein